MNSQAIFIAATGQNVGKTTLCLGIIAGLKKRFSSVGFIKPVGQQHVRIHEKLIVDKDVVLFKEHFHLPAAWEEMSPVMVPAGFTRKYIDGEISEESLTSIIRNSYRKIASENSYTIVEGTGHVGVGSVVGINNAKVASELGLDVVIIVSGGLGSAHDELALNIEMCKAHGVRIRGVILNRVNDDKRDMILDYFPRTLKKWGIPLIGCVPYNAFLSIPTIKDIENLFEATLLSGERHRFRHLQNSRLVAGSLESYLTEMIPDELIITPASREDIIEATLREYHETESQGKVFGGGMILTSRQPPSDHILKLIRQVDIPILYAPICSYDAMVRITSYIAKIRTEDVEKIKKAIDLVEKYIDIDLL